LFLLLLFVAEVGLATGLKTMEAFFHSSALSHICFIFSLCAAFG
jgi:hypothetical protein